MFHMGGDEVNFDCWEKSKEIVDWVGEKKGQGDPGSGGFFDLWGHFQSNARNRLLKANNGQKTDVILWTSTLTKPEIIEK